MRGKKAREIRRIVNDIYPYIFIHDVCSTHNVERFADTPAARKRLVRHLLKVHPIEHIEEAFAELRDVYTVPPDQLRLEQYL